MKSPSRSAAKPVCGVADQNPRCLAGDNPATRAGHDRGRCEGPLADDRQDLGYCVSESVGVGVRTNRACDLDTPSEDGLEPDWTNWGSDLKSPNGVTSLSPSIPPPVPPR